MTHDDVKGLDGVEWNGLTAALEGLFKCVEGDLGHPADGHFEHTVAALAR